MHKMHKFVHKMFLSKGSRNITEFFPHIRGVATKSSVVFVKLPSMLLKQWFYIKFLQYLLLYYCRSSSVFPLLCVYDKLLDGGFAVAVAFLCLGQSRFLNNFRVLHSCKMPETFKKKEEEVLDKSGRQ